MQTAVVVSRIMVTKAENSHTWSLASAKNCFGSELQHPTSLLCMKNKSVNKSPHS